MPGENGTVKLSFVILHYLACATTQACIRTLLSTFGGDVHIVVVDNASPDGSGAKLREMFSSIPRVHFVLLESNLGFASGNNAGYRYAVENLSADFVVVMNNDVLIEDPSFADGIASEYRAKPFAVLGPDIYSPDAGLHQSPSLLRPMSRDLVVDRMRSIQKKNRCFLYHYMSWKLKIHFHLAQEKKPANSSFDVPHEDCVLHGACYVFSPDFIKARPREAFNPSTFLYCEEEILYWECRRQNLEMRYTPSLHVKHLEDRSTVAAFASDCRRTRMKQKRLEESLKVLLEVMDSCCGEN